MKMSNKINEENLGEQYGKINVTENKTQKGE